MEVEGSCLRAASRSLQGPQLGKAQSYALQPVLRSGWEGAVLQRGELWSAPWSIKQMLSLRQQLKTRLEFRYIKEKSCSFLKAFVWKVIGFLKVSCSNWSRFVSFCISRGGLLSQILSAAPAGPRCTSSPSQACWGLSGHNNRAWKKNSFCWALHSFAFHQHDMCHPSFFFRFFFHRTNTLYLAI